MIQRGHDRCHQLKHVHEQESRQKRAHSITFLAKQTGRTEAGENDHSLSDAEKEVGLSGMLLVLLVLQFLHRYIPSWSHVRAG